MTTEEKAKAYEMALEAARKELGVDRKEWKIIDKVLKSIFPQLRESEDERIRKELVNFLQSPFINENLTDEKVAPWIAYLEKQKNAFENGRQFGIMQEQARQELEWTDEKQKEQKPNIELIQKSWYMEGYKDHEHNREPMWIVKTGEGGPKYEPNLRYGQMLAQEQKPAWNEEDEEHLDSIIESYKELLKDYSVNNGVDYIPYNSPAVTRTVLNDIKFLKSLRPSWKPSDQDELMKLKYAGTSTKLD